MSKSGGYFFISRMIAKARSIIITTMYKVSFITHTPFRGFAATTLCTNNYTIPLEKCQYNPPAARQACFLFSCQISIL